MAMKIQCVQNVPLERFEETFIRKPYKGKRSCPLPLEMLSHFSPLSPFKKARGVSPSAEGDLGALPLKTPPKGAHTLWKPEACETTARQIPIYKGAAYA